VFLGVVCVNLGLAVLIQYRRSVTDTQIHDDSIYRASIASRAKNEWFCKKNVQFYLDWFNTFPLRDDNRTVEYE